MDKVMINYGITTEESDKIKQNSNLITRPFHVNSLFRITPTLQNVPGSQEKNREKKAEKRCHTCWVKHAIYFERT